MAPQLSQWQAPFVGLLALFLFRAHAACAADSILAITTPETERLGAQNKKLDAPALNPTPTRFLTLQGTKASEMGLIFTMSYGTSLHACDARSIWGLLGGAPAVMQMIHHTYRVSPGPSNFQVVVPLDRFEPGRCGWFPLGVSHATLLSTLDMNPVGAFGLLTIRPDGAPELSLRISCRFQFNPAQQRFIDLCFPEPPSRSHPTSLQGAVVNLTYEVKNIK